MIFISYRRDDSAGHAGRLYDNLEEHLGAETVFRDVDTLTPGVEFPRELDARLARSTVVLVLIGRRWLDPANAARLADPHDFVRQEIEEALVRSGIRVVPVLVEGARMPEAAALPAELRSLTMRQAIDLNEAAYDAGIEKIVRLVQPLRPAARLTRIAVALALPMLAIGGWMWWRAGASQPLPPDPDLDTVSAAHELIRTGHPVQAWDMLKPLSPAKPFVRMGQEDAAMAVLRESRLPAGQDFATFSQVYLPVLTRGTLAVNGQRKADLLAHLGWAEFLASRENGMGTPVARYEEALAAQAGNVYTHAMWGHWLLWDQREAGAAPAWLHFETALAAQREVAWVHHLRVSALMNVRGENTATTPMLARALDAMRRAGVALEDHTAARIASLYGYLSYKQPSVRDALREALPYADHLATFDWLLPEAKAVHGQERTRAFWRAVFQKDAEALMRLAKQYPDAPDVAASALREAARVGNMAP